MGKVYNKLVRDKIPEIIRAKGEHPIISTLDTNEYKTELEKKLKEECAEVLAAEGKDRLEEFADVLEVLNALAILENSSIKEVEQIAKNKSDKKGTFSKRIFLEEVVENEQ